LGATHFEGHRLDFNRFPLEARLVYDCDNFKEVGFVKLKPLEFKCHVNERGDQATVELRPKVLTSQLEDMLFRVKLVAVDSITKQVIQSLFVLSESIKVVSKPEQVKKKKAATKTKKPVAEEKEVTKKQITEVLGDYLERIESTCTQHQTLLSLLLEASTKTQQAIDITLEAIEVPQSKKQKKPQTPELTPFEQAFYAFVESYDKLDPEEKPNKIRKVMKNTSTRDTESFTEMVETFQNESASPATIEKTKDPVKGRGCQCSHCPHKEELQRIDDFYNRFLTAPDGIL